MQYKSFAIGAVCIALAASPTLASAHGHYRHGDGLAFGLLAGTVAVAAAIVTAPFVLAHDVVQQPVAYGPPPAYYQQPPAYYAQPHVQYAPQPVYYAPPPPPPYGYYQQPAYYAPRYYYPR